VAPMRAGAGEKQAPARRVGARSGRRSKCGSLPKILLDFCLVAGNITADAFLS
jgi:hypothetical protein